MSVPFALGHVIDIIYTADPEAMKQNLDKVCLALTGIFLLGASANFGRVYLMNIAGEERDSGSKETRYLPSGRICAHICIYSIYRERG